MAMGFPDNFNRLHEGEEFVRSKSIETIEGSHDLLMHAELIERSMDLIDYFVRQHSAEIDDTLTVQLLGIRLFNGSAAGIKLLLSGYYQTSALQQRDMLETIFLLDYFRSDRKLIAEWRASDDRVRRDKFGPAAVRKALDKRDGFTERKRDKAYKLLCELAGHPTYAGFRMLTPRPGGDAHCGPFFELTSFKAVYEELAKHLFQAATAFGQFFPNSTPDDYRMRIAFMEVQGAWAEKFYGRPFDKREIDIMRARAAEMGKGT